MANKSSVSLLFKTGINSSNYPYFASKILLDAWMLTHTKNVVYEYSQIKLDSISKNGYNVSCVHVDKPYNDLILCDYLAIASDNDPRVYYAAVTSREWVSHNSTRLHFQLDYVLSFWDTIEIGTSFVERMHVTDDWDDGTDQVGMYGGRFTASKYLLPEPVPVNLIERSDLIIQNPLDEDVNKKFVVNKFYTIASSDGSGNFTQPQIKYQCGGVVQGYTYSGSESEINTIISKYVSEQNTMINRFQPLAAYVNAIYYGPEIIDNGSNRPQWGEIKQDIAKFLYFNGLPKIKNAKTLDYIQIAVVGNSGVEIMKPSEYGRNFNVNYYFVGGPDGFCEIRFKNKLNRENTKTVSTYPWPPLSLGTRFNSERLQLNPNIGPAISNAISGAKTYINNNIQQNNNRNASANTNDDVVFTPAIESIMEGYY